MQHQNHKYKPHMNMNAVPPEQQRLLAYTERRVPRLHIAAVACACTNCRYASSGSSIIEQCAHVLLSTACVFIYVGGRDDGEQTQ